MAKQTNKPRQTAQPPVLRPKQPQAVVTEVIPEVDPKIPAWLYSFKVQAIIVGLLAFIFYFNTSSNEYALDDTIIIVKNEYVHQGFAGIPDILTKDAFDSYYKQFNSSNQLSGGRYRPLSILSFAVEQQFFGAISKTQVDSFITYGMSFQMKTPGEKKFIHEMHIRHFFNVLLFTLSVIVLLYFLRYVVFKSNHIMALIATILFAIHPIHTEVVANVKSRDEIMSLLFICLTFITAFKYHEHKQRWMQWLSLGLYLLAFLSKEYAIAMMVLLPLSFYLFNGFSLSKSIMATLPYMAVVGVYGLLRLQVVAPMNEASDNDILNNPYALADATEKVATKIATSLNYLKLLVFPHPLSSDYSFNTIPYKDFSNPLVWLSMAIYGWLSWFTITCFRKFGSRETDVKLMGVQLDAATAKTTLAILCFACSFFMFHFLLICNLIFNIGATMGERLIYHSSVGFCIALAFLLYKGLKNMKPALAGLMVVLIVVCGFKTIERNKDWKNDETLFGKDIAVSPNSVLVNANVASSLINKAETEKDEKTKIYDLTEGIKHYDKALAIDTTFVSGYMNRGVAYMKMGVPDSAKYNYDQVAKFYPNYPKLYEIYYNLGVCFYMNKKPYDAINVWKTVMKMKPDYIVAQQSINTVIKELQAQQQAKPQPPQQAQPAVPVKGK